MEPSVPKLALMVLARAKEAVCSEFRLAKIFKQSCGGALYFLVPFCIPRQCLWRNRQTDRYLADDWPAAWTANSWRCQATKSATRRRNSAQTEPKWGGREFISACRPT